MLLTVLLSGKLFKEILNKYKNIKIPCGKFGSPYLGKATAAARAVVPIPTGVCSIFECPNSGVTTSVWTF